MGWSVMPGDGVNVVFVSAETEDLRGEPTFRFFALSWSGRVSAGERDAAAVVSSLDRLKVGGKEGRKLISLFR